jgi:hypothetical protein
MRALLLWSLAVTGAVWLALAHQRAESANPQGVGIFLHLLLYQDYHAALLFAAVLVVAPLRSARQAANALARWCGGHAVIVAAATAIVLAAGAVLVYHRHPLSMDEFGPLFQSKVFLEGGLTGRYPLALLDWLIPEPFQGIFFRADPTGAVVSLYWPGFALLLAPFSALGIPWLLNPLTGGATVLVMHGLGKRLLGSDAAAGYVVLFTLASPAVTINALSYYAWPAHLLANACFALLLLSPSVPRALLAGLIGSVALVLHNPMPHLLFALPWIVWLATRPGAARLLGALAAGYLPVCIVLGFGWRVYLYSLDSYLTVDDLAMPVSAVLTSWDTFWSTVTSVLDWPSAAVLEARLWGLAKLWLWASPALVTAAIWGAWRTRQSGRVWLVLGACALLTYFGYFAVRYDQGHGWGYRYFHAVWLVLPLYAAAAVRPGERDEPGGAPLAGYLASCALLSLVALTGLRALQVEAFVRGHLAQLPSAVRGEARVLIVDPSKGYYAEDLVQNDPFLRNPVPIFASRGPEADEAMMRRHFPQLRPLPSRGSGTAWGYPAP